MNFFLPLHRKTQLALDQNDDEQQQIDEIKVKQKTGIVHHRWKIDIDERHDQQIQKQQAEKQFKIFL